MKSTAAFSLAIVLALLALGQSGCEPLLEPDTRGVAEAALRILRSNRGSTSQYHEPGDGPTLGGLDRVDTIWVDTTEGGIYTNGYWLYDDGNTPEDSTDDIVSFRGQKHYLDWDVIQSIWLSIHIHVEDRRTEMAVANVVTDDSAYYSLDKVNRPGGLQYGPAFWTDGQESIEMTMGVHHRETPDNWDDNYSYLEFELIDPNTDSPFSVHADFLPDASGSGQIEDVDGGLVATFNWDEFGRGSLVVNGDIYPFRW